MSPGETCCVIRRKGPGKVIPASLPEQVDLSRLFWGTSLPIRKHRTSEVKGT